MTTYAVDFTVQSSNIVDLAAKIYAMLEYAGDGVTSINVLEVQD